MSNKGTDKPSGFECKVKRTDPLIEFHRELRQESENYDAHGFARAIINVIFMTASAVLVGWGIIVIGKL